MNKKMLIIACLGFMSFACLEIESKCNKHSDIEKRMKEQTDTQGSNSNENRESQIQNFFDPNLDQDIKIDGVFQNPSKLTIWIREFGIGLLCRYYVAKYWIKGKLQGMFNLIN